ncbi:TerC family protein [Nocardioides zeae]|uniref:TerC family protein n=1 Tax=Nocardioides imazamoxiresistens TaxID=3231893 RepID=A0ABU3PV23_9ACTN|nr:TerC family protein [Nocardioides zeae]MDT9593080.1 TerC family protein [Nocardioides zeae]
MEVSPLVWGLTIAVIAGLLAFDFFFHVRKAHIPTLKEAAIWSAIYVGLAIVFGFFVLANWGGTYGGEYFAGYITEKALSVDNLFVFLIIMASFKVPREDQQKVLLFGIVFALFARSAFIFVGAAAINNFSWVFYLFGAILIYTALSLLKEEDEEEGEIDNFVIRLAKRWFHTSDEYDGDKMFTVVNGKRMLTPMLLVMIAIGGTDLLFALDSIPAIFGLTQESYIVFTATAFSLMGLRQLFFLIDGLLDRLVFLSYGLAVILGFIGVKLFIHALHENELPFINGGEHVTAIPEVSITVSLSVIVGVLALTVIASLLSPRGKAESTVKAAKANAEHYLDGSYTHDPEEHQRLYSVVAAKEQQIQDLPEKFRPEGKEKAELDELFARVHAAHDDVAPGGKNL